jgi:hypothetical protein
MKCLRLHFLFIIARYPESEGDVHLARRLGRAKLVVRLELYATPSRTSGGVVKLNDGSRAVVLVRDPDVGGVVELFEPAGHER